MQFVKSTVVGALALLLSACGSPSDLNEKNFRAAIETHLNAAKKLCLGRTSWPWRIDVMPTDKGTSAEAKQIAALVDANVIKLVSEKKVYSWLSRAYDVVDPSLAYVDSNESASSKFFMAGTGVIYRDLCYGRRSLDKVIKWVELGTMGSKISNYVNVKYTYKVNLDADWAKRQDVQAAFSGLASEIANQGKLNQDIALVLSNLGWEAFH